MLIAQRTDEELRFCLIDYARGRGGVTLTESTRGKSLRFQRMAASQDIIGWRRFMEGMISKELLNLYNFLFVQSEVEMPGTA